nr:hypothetical protein [Tanacetum cinerariifolium]
MESTLQVVYDVLRRSPFFRAFLVTTDVPEIYMQEFWATATVHQHSIRFKMDTIKHIVDLESFREIYQSKSSGNIDYAFLIWEDLVYQVEHKNQKKSNEMYYPRFKKVIIHHFMTKKPSIPRRNRVNWHYVKDDILFFTIKVVSRHQNTQQYDVILPIELTTKDIRNTKVYKEYYACATGEAAPKPKASARKKKGGSSSSTTPPTPIATLTLTTTVVAAPRLSVAAKGKQPARATSPTDPSDVERTEAEQLKIILKRSRHETHISQQGGSGTDEGTGSKPGIPDVPSDDSDEEISWNSSDDEDAEKVTDDDDDEEEIAKIDEQEATESGGEDEETKSDGESEEEETTEKEEESFDPITRTPEESEDGGNGEEDQGLRISEEERMQEEEEADKLYHDVDINQGWGLQHGGSGTDEGTGSKPVVPDVPSDDSEEEISWNSSDDEETDTQEQDIHDDEGDEKDESDDDEEDDDDDKDGRDDDEESENNEESDDEETREEESLDPIARTPKDSEDDGNDEEDQGLRISEEERLHEEKEADELYRDVDINQGRGLQLSQDIEDSHMTLTPVHSDGMESIFATASSPMAPLQTSTPIMTPSTIATITTLSHAPIPPTTIPSESVNAQLESEVLTRSSHSSRTSYAVAADLSEMELKKFLIEKIEGNKRRDDDDDQGEGPSARSDRGSKRQREGREPESARALLEPTTRSTGRSTIGSNSRQASASESIFAEEPVQTTSQIEEPSHLVFETGAEDQPIVQTSQHPEWFSQPKKPPTPDHTPIDFSNFIMNRLGVDTLTPELLAGPTYELMKGSCKILTELEYHLEEVYKATTDQLDWINPEGQQMFTRSIVIQRRVEDLQLGVESYQKRLNLTKPDTYRSGLKRGEAYTAYSNPRGFIYQNKDKKNRLIRIDELHKFSDGMLNDEPESASAALEPVTRSAGRSTTRSKSRQVSASESAFAEEPVQTTYQMDEPSYPVFETCVDHDWNKTLPAIQGSTQTWISDLAKQADSRSSFNKLLDTPLDFSYFIMNWLRVDTLTPKLLAGPTFDLMKGSCTSLIELKRLKGQTKRLKGQTKRLKGQTWEECRLRWS